MCTLTKYRFYYSLTGLVVFLEEDHYVAEDFLYILELMQLKSNELCPKCNILSLGTYLKTFNYYTYNKKVSSCACPGCRKRAHCFSSEGTKYDSVLYDDR